MFVKIEKIQPADTAEPPPQVVEIITPRTNQAAIAAAENLLAALSPAAEPFALEIAATREARWFQLRAVTTEALTQLQEQVGVAYPQA